MLLALFVFDTTAHAHPSSLRWAGLVNEATIVDNGEVFAVEDGGRIRHRDTSGVWTFQPTPLLADSLLRRVFARVDGGTTQAFAVSLDGLLLQKVGAGPWTTVLQQEESAPGLTGQVADLWDVHFVTATDGYTLGLHGIWRGSTSGGHWQFADFFEGTTKIDPGQLELYAFDFAPNGTALASAQPGKIFKQRAGDLDKWDLVFDLSSLCQTNAIPKCVQDNFCTAGIPFELWDLEISRHPTAPLAISVGGVGTGCGLVLASYDNGATWSVEPHECQCQFAGCTTCNGNPDYTQNNNDPTDVWRLRFFRELYNVGIFHGDNSAVVSGYNGQIVVRDPDADPNTPGNQPVWRDRSTYSNLQLQAPDAVTLPGYGIATNGGTASNGIAYATSMGGYIRRTSNGGQDWEVEDRPANPVLAEPWRVRDVAFRNPSEGWMVSQFNRIARTDDGGETWNQDSTGADPSKPLLKAIAIDGTGGVGVAVGQFEDGTNTFPTILINDDLSDAQNPIWAAPNQSVVPVAGVAGVASEFKDVDWVSGQEFWAVGRQGLIVYSDPTVGLDLWRQFVPPLPETYATFSDFDIDGMSFATSGHGVLVGARTVDGKVTGKAYHAHRSGANISWSEIQIPNETALSPLTDVDFDGTTAYATATRRTVGNDVGIVLKATLSGGVFSDFVAVAQTFDECTIGDAATAVPILMEVEIAPGGAIWVGGQCGKLWKSADGGVNWNSVRSLTDAHVHGMSFPAADTGFAACHRASRSGHCVVRILP